VFEYTSLIGFAALNEAGHYHEAMRDIRGSQPFIPFSFKNITQLSKDAIYYIL
jgi:hypothetical protein